MRKPLVAGNAKMNLTRAGLVGVLEALKRDLSLAPPACEVVYCPPSPWLLDAAAVLTGTRIGLGAQNMHWEASGAFTGEIAAGMLCEAGCRYVILGHSERRTLFGETDAAVRRKAEAALAEPSLDALRPATDPELPEGGGVATLEAEGFSRGEARRRWAELIRLVYEVDPMVCPKCGGQMRVIALIREPKVVDKISRHLRAKGRDARAGPWATGPPGAQASAALA